MSQDQSQQEAQAGQTLPDRRERFIDSKCDRCGKTTPAKQNGIGDLYVLPDEFGPPLTNQGAFCKHCIDRYDKANWLEWFKKHRPDVLELQAGALSERELSELKALANAATPGPWIEVSGDDEYCSAIYGILSEAELRRVEAGRVIDGERQHRGDFPLDTAWVMVDPGVAPVEPPREADIEFMLRARTAVPRLIAEVRAGRAREARLRVALERICEYEREEDQQAREYRVLGPDEVGYVFNLAREALAFDTEVPIPAPAQPGTEGVGEVEAAALRVVEAAVEAHEDIATACLLAGLGNAKRTKNRLGRLADVIQQYKDSLDTAAQGEREGQPKRRLPTIDEITGIDPDFTGSMSTDAYLRMIRGETE